MIRRCWVCLRRDVPSNALGRLVVHSPAEFELLFLLSERCTGSGSEPAEHLSETLPWIELMLR